MPSRGNPVIAEILRQGAGRPRKHVLAALATGRIESNFRNLSYGDADSQGWRQERASLYRNPTNLSASVRRFYQEAAQHDRGQSAGRLAADVQRPAEQFRGRYADVMGEARQILRRGGIPTRGTGGGGGVGVRTPEGLRFSPAQQTANAVALLSSLREPEQAARPEVTPPSAPAFSATAPLPRGFQAPETSGAPVRQRLDVAGALEALKGLSEGGIPSATYGGRTVQIGGGRGGRGGRVAPGSRRRSHLKEEFYNGPGGVNVDEGRRVGKGFVSGHTDHVHVATATPREAVQLGKLAQRMGLHVGEHPRFGGVEPVHAKGSFHYRRRAVDVSGSPRQMRRYSRRVAQIYGV